MSKSSHNIRSSNRCTGDNYTGANKWYFPIGSNKLDSMVCEYCYSNCTYKNNMVSVDHSEHELCICNCSLKDKHCQMQNFTCPLCDLGLIEPSGIGICSECHVGLTDLNAYCNVCSYVNTKCVTCGENISTGDEYASRISTLLQMQIDKLESYINDLKTQITKTNYMFGGKTIHDIKTMANI